MGRLEFLQYTNRALYKESLACLALEEGITHFQLLDRLIGRNVGTSVQALKEALGEMESDGLIMSVNSCYMFQENWLKELVLFLDEFEESKKEIDLCEALLEKKHGRP